MTLDRTEIEARLPLPAADPERIAIQREVTVSARSLALLIHDLIPGSREKALAIEALELCVHWAHAGVARREPTRAGRRLARRAPAAPPAAITHNSTGQDHS